MDTIAVSITDLWDETYLRLLIKHCNIPLPCFTKKLETHITHRHFFCNYPDCSTASVQTHTCMHIFRYSYIHTHTDVLCLVPQGQASVPLKVVAIKNIILQLSQTWWICTTRAVRHITYNQQYVTFFTSTHAFLWHDLITKITKSTYYYLNKVVFTFCR